MTAPKGPLDHVLDLLVYAPVGLALAARDDLAGVVEKGKSQVAQQVRTARIVGELAVVQGRTEVSRFLRRATENLPASRRSADGPEASPAATADPSDRGESAAPPAPAASAVRRVPAGAEAVPSGAHLAIPGYDTLSASQVVQRLAGLTADELEAVAAYEDATRGRRTILTRVTQLRAGSAS